MAGGRQHGLDREGWNGASGFSKVGQRKEHIINRGGKRIEMLNRERARTVKEAGVTFIDDSALYPLARRNRLFQAGEAANVMYCYLNEALSQAVVPLLLSLPSHPSAFLALCRTFAYCQPPPDFKVE